MARTPQQRITDISIIYKGEEPKGNLIDSNNSNYNVLLLKAFNWYSADKTKNDAHKYIREYIKKHMPSELKTFEKVDERIIIPTYGWMAKLISSGAKFSEAHLEKFTSHVTYLLNDVDKKTKIAAMPKATVQIKPTIQESIKEKIAEYIGNLEGNLDDYFLNDKEFSLYDNLKTQQIPQVYVTDIREWAQRKLAEITPVVEGNDKYLVEAYSNFGKRQLKNYFKLIQSFIDDCDKYQQYKKANRKPRVRKEKTPTQQVQSLKYMAKDDTLKLKSVTPSDIVGATQLWLYNTKTKKLTLYKTDDTKGFTVKGSTLQNYDPELSLQKTLRKPEESIKDLMSAGKVQLRKFMDNIRAKASEVNGRINADTIILRAIK